jgi:hypothetical protein
MQLLDEFPITTDNVEVTNYFTVSVLVVYYNKLPGSGLFLVELIRNGLKVQGAF